MITENEPASLGGVILVVDDDESICTIAARMLQRLGYPAITASNGHAAIALFEEHAQQVVCVLLDMTMPEMSGEAVSRAIQAIDPDARIVMMSGHAEDDMISRMGDVRLAGFLQKPFNLARMRSTIARVASDGE
jgi:two-component system cell cycle sensor histidine kinase/response regulator CckA